MKKIMLVVALALSFGAVLASNIISPTAVLAEADGGGD